MGALFSSLKGSSDAMPDVQVDLLTNHPTSRESKLFVEVANQQKDMSDLLLLLKKYKGCNEEIREAISKPSEESNIRVWKALQPSITTSTKLYKYSLVLGSYCLRIFEHVCSEPSAVQGLTSNPGLVALLVKAFCFIIDFDEIKTHNSDLQNDFSFYRRSISKFRMMDKGTDPLDMIITDEEANCMSLFYAHHTPMFKSVSQALLEHTKKKPELGPKLLDYFSLLAGSCYHSVVKQRVTAAGDKDSLLRALVVSTILYDTLHPEGVLVKGSPIDVKLVVKAVTATNVSLSEPLMNGLRFNLIRLNDKATPKQIKSLLGVN